MSAFLQPFVQQRIVRSKGFQPKKEKACVSIFLIGTIQKFTVQVHKKVGFC